jgi:hypothetical protein
MSLTALVLVTALTSPAVRDSAPRVLQVPRDFPTIQGAIDAARPRDTVLVAPGRYVENLRFKGKGIVVASRFARTRDRRDVERTVIDGSRPAHPDSGSVVMFVNQEDTTAVLEGFTVTGGTGTVWLDAKDKIDFREGGGILCELSAPTIRHNHIQGNRATEVRSGVMSAGGGGIRCGYAEPVIVGNVIRDNGGRYGAGIVLFHSAATVRNNLIVRNRGGEDFGGGGLWVVGHLSRRLTNVIEHNTIARNVVTGADTGRTATMRGRGGGVITASANVTLRRNIIWGNAQARGGQVDFPPGAPVALVENLVQGGAPGDGTLDADPRFVDEDRFELREGSPARGGTPRPSELGAYGGRDGERGPRAP